MAAVGACDEPINAVGNSGRTRAFILCRHLHGRQVHEAMLVGCDVGQAGMRSAGGAPIDGLDDVGPRGVHAVVGLEVHPLVFDAAPLSLPAIGVSNEPR